MTAIRQQYNENAKAIERSWGGGIMGVKSQAATQKTEKALAKELDAKEEKAFADRVKADQELCDGFQRRSQMRRRANNKHYVHSLKSQIAARDNFRRSVSGGQA